METFVSLLIGPISLDNGENKTCKMWGVLEPNSQKYLLVKNFYLYSTLIGTYLAGLITNISS